MRMGTHILVDLKGCPKELLERVENIKPILEEIVEKAKLTKVNEVFHQFEPYGVTGVIVLAESHFSIHTWPEHGTAAIDIFTCGERESAERAFKLVIEKFKPKEYKHEIIER